VKRHLILATALLTLAQPLAQAQETTSTEQTTPPAPSAPRQPNIPHAAEKTLANGLRIIVVPKPGLPLVSARLLVKTGGEADPAGRGGLADMTASLLTKGTRTRSAEEIARGVEALGASLESGAGWDQSFVALSSLSTTFPQALGYVADVVRNPTFKADEINRLRDQNIDALSVALQQPRSLAAFVATRVLFGQGAYGHNLGGTPESLKKIARADLTRFHATWFRPDNAVLIVAGDVTSADAFALAQKQFGNWSKPSTKLPASIARSAATAAPRVVVVDLPKAGQAAVLVTRPALRRADPAYEVAEVTNAVLGGGYSARLNQEIRIKRGLSYGAGSHFDARRAAGQFTASTQTKNESAAEVARIILDEMNKLGASTLDPAELTARKAVLVGDFGRALETGSGLVAQVGELALYGLSLGEIDRYISTVTAVAPAEVQKFAASGLAGNDASIVIVGDAGTFLPALRQRFKSIDVIPINQLDLNKPSLRK